MSKLPYEHMGKSVFVTNELYRCFEPRNGNKITWKNKTCLDYGWLVGFRVKYNGVHHLGDYNGSGVLEISEGISCALVCINPRHKPIFVALNQYELTRYRPNGKGGTK